MSVNNKAIYVIDMKIFIIALLVSTNTLLSGQQISGTVLEMNSDVLVEYVNIGIIGKNVGTVADHNGNYTLKVSHEHYDDTLKFSCIGYHSYSVKVSDFLKKNNGNVSLEKRDYGLSEIVIRPKNTRQRTLGFTGRGKVTVACFADSVRGAEVGVIMKNKNRSFIKEVNINFLICSYDTIFFRLNIYKVLGDMQFENILKDPVYIVSTKKEAKNKLSVDLRHLNLVVDGDFLVTFEHVKDLGYGKLCFRAGFINKSYLRETSQGTWETIPVSISISAVVDSER